MKKLLLILTALTSLTIANVPAFANLGDTYAQSCSRFGGKGTVDKKNHRMIWYLPNTHSFVYESFVNNACVALLIVPDEGYHFSVSFMEELLSMQSAATQTWTRSDALDVNIAEWKTTDGLLMASLSRQGNAQFAYTWWMERKGLIQPAPDYGLAPVEDNAQKTGV
jgi:hypothetical protein